MREVTRSRVFLIEEITYEDIQRKPLDFTVTKREVFLKKQDALYEYEYMLSSVKESSGRITIENEDDIDDSEIADYEKGGYSELENGHAHVRSFSYFDADTNETVDVSLIVVECVKSVRNVR